MDHPIRRSDSPALTSPTDQIINHLDTLNRLYTPELVERHGVQYVQGPESYAQEAQARIGAAIQRFTLPGDPYRDEVARIHEQNRAAPLRAAQLLGVLRALLDDYRAGQMNTVQELVHADVFSDFLDMSQELLDKGFKDPAAVLSGSVIEEHLRKLAVKSNITVANSDGSPRKAEALNADLRKGQAYDANEQKQITAWLGLRNSAAHGHYNDYDHGQIALMIQGVRDFLGRHAA
jgi:hypothetical protein